MGKKKMAIIDDSVVTQVKAKKPQKKQNKETQTSKTEESGDVSLQEGRVSSGNSSDDAAISNNQEESADSSLSVQNDSSTDSGGQASMTETKTDNSKPAKKAKKSTKQEKKARKHRSAKYIEVREKVERMRLYSIPEATQLAKDASYSKYDGTLEVHINTSNKGVRGLVTLPFASGKKLKIMAFGKGADESGADMVGDDAALAEIAKGKISFDVLVTTPDWMPKLARAAKVLGPKGLMPNPKSGTISMDLKKTVGELQGGKTEYKSESKANVIHLGIGKLSQPSEELSQNLKLLLATIGKSKIKKAVISPTLGPSIRIDLNSI
jgi:large subunit ribosomal protein L1